MLRVTIDINGRTITVNSAVNQQETNDDGETKYELRDGTIVWHRRSDGAVELAKKVLEETEEPSTGVTHVVDE